MTLKNKYDLTEGNLNYIKGTIDQILPLYYEIKSIQDQEAFQNAEDDVKKEALKIED